MYFQIKITITITQLQFQNVLFSCSCSHRSVGWNATTSTTTPTSLVISNGENNFDFFLSFFLSFFDSNLPASRKQDCIFKMCQFLYLLLTTITQRFMVICKTRHYARAMRAKRNNFPCCLLLLLLMLIIFFIEDMSNQTVENSACSLSMRKVGKQSLWVLLHYKYVATDYKFEC